MKNNFSAIKQKVTKISKSTKNQNSSCVSLAWTTKNIRHQLSHYSLLPSTFPSPPLPPPSPFTTHRSRSGRLPFWHVQTLHSTLMSTTHVSSVSMISQLFYWSNWKVSRRAVTVLPADNQDGTQQFKKASLHSLFLLTFKEDQK